MEQTIDICMVVDNDVRHDGRVLKEAASLTEAGWNLVIVGISTADPSPPDDEVIAGVRIVLVKPRFLNRWMPGKYGNAIRRLIGLAQTGWKMRQLNARVYHAHDFTGLLALVAGGLWRRFVYDSHELYFDRSVKGKRTPTQFVFGYLRFVERFMARRAAGVITVSDPIADRLAQTLEIQRPLVVRNAVDMRTLQNAVPLPRQPGQHIIAHTGYLAQGRHLSELVSALSYLPDDVVLALIGDGVLRQQLVDQAQAASVGDRLLLIHPVNPFNLPSTLAQADASAVLITADALSYQYSLPNKFFEAVAAGLPLVYGTTQEVNRLAQEYGFGAACDPTDPRSIADAILTVLEPEANARFRANAEKARETLNWEQEEKKLIGLYRQILD
ncbi:MAG: glycosyltransferase [Anaerolineae bacterium]|nr:glycosyltransferase [Anaerolineae bacterium]